MTAVDLLRTCLHQGIALTVTPDGQRIRYRAPTPALLTPALVEALRQHKPVLIPILQRLEAMRRHGVDLETGRTAPPVPVVVWPARVGGPGRCFSCGDALGHPEAYGRCAPCQTAAELFWATRSRPDLETDTAHG